MINEKNEVIKPNQLTYEQLRDFGLDYIRKIGSGRWTDFNVHDPGVTAIEALALAVADLSYRSSFKMADLLTRKGAKGPAMEGTMFPARDILAQEPTTLDDYRKLILENVPGVRNVWFETVERTVSVKEKRRQTFKTIHTRGYYDVFIELESEECLLDDSFIMGVVGGLDSETQAEEWRYSYKERYKDYIRDLFLRHRNIGEIVKDINILSTVEVGIMAEVEIESDIDVRTILQKIYDLLYDYICPTIQFHTIEDLLAKGRKPSEIFGACTPLLGFVDREDLSSFDRKMELNASDVIGMMMKIPGIRSIRHLKFVLHTDQGDIADTRIKLEDRYGSTFTLCPRFMRSGIKRGKTFMNNVVFLKRKLSFFPPAGDRGVMVETRQDERIRLADGFATDVPAQKGTYRDLDRYFSFQNLFPKAYRLGVDSLPDTASKLRRAEWLQLKAYLSFFDQLLADYLSHIDSFLDLLSVEPSDGETCGDVYFHKHILDSEVDSISAVLLDYPDYKVPDDDPDRSISRKSQVMNHLLSRFSDSFAEFSALSFVKSSEYFSFRETVEDKKRFLKDYPIISSRRSSGMDFTLGLQVTGAERRILRKIGVNDPENRTKLADGDLFGIHIIEHNLLAPFTNEGVFLEVAREEGLAVLVDDPYTFHVTVAAPGWTELSLNPTFRGHVEKVIREELPAHLSVKICWLSRSTMAVLEDALESWMDFLANYYYRPGDDNWDKGYDFITYKVSAALSTFFNVYPEAIIAPDETFDFDDNLPMYDFTHLGSRDKDEFDDEIRPEDLPYYLKGDSGIREHDKFHIFDPREQGGGQSDHISTSVILPRGIIPRPKPKRIIVRLDINKDKKKAAKQTVVPIEPLPKATVKPKKAKPKKVDPMIESHLSFPGMRLLMEDSPVTASDAGMAAIIPPPKEEAPPKARPASKKKQATTIIETEQ